jgi:hypothetical protein
MSLVWAIAWLIVAREGTVSKQSRGRTTVPISNVRYQDLLVNRTTLAVMFSGFAAYCGLSLLMVWFTPYLQLALGYSPEWSGWLTALPWVCSSLVIAAAAILSQRALLRGASSRAARGMPASLCVALGGAAIFLLPFCQSPALKLALVAFGLGLPTAISVLALPIVSEFVPMPQRSSILATVNAVITLAGVIAPYTMGRIIEGGVSTAAGYEHGFLVLGIVTTIGGMLGIAFIHPEKELSRFGGASPGAEGQIAQASCGGGRTAFK